MTHPPVPPVGLCFLRGVTLVRVRGGLEQADRRAVPRDVSTVAQALAATGTPLVLNVAAVVSIDTNGLRWLMRLTRPARGRGGPLILESPTYCVEQVLTLTGCHSWFTAATRPGPGGRVDTARLIHRLTA